MRVALLEQPLPQTVPLQQVAEVQNRRLVGQRTRQAQPHEAAHRLHLVEQVLHPGVAQVVEQLHAVHAQHHPQRIGTPTAPGLRIERLDLLLQTTPRNQTVHLLEKCLAPRATLLRVVLQLRKRRLLHGPRSTSSAMDPFCQNRLVQTFLSAYVPPHPAAHHDGDMVPDSTAPARRAWRSRPRWLAPVDAGLEHLESSHRPPPVASHLTLASRAILLSGMGAACTCSAAHPGEPFVVRVPIRASWRHRRTRARPLRTGPGARSQQKNGPALASASTTHPFVRQDDQSRSPFHPPLFRANPFGIPSRRWRCSNALRRYTKT